MPRFALASSLQQQAGKRSSELLTAHCLPLLGGQLCWGWCWHLRQRSWQNWRPLRKRCFRRAIGCCRCWAALQSFPLRRGHRTRHSTSPFRGLRGSRFHFVSFRSTWQSVCHHALQGLHRMGGLRREKRLLQFTWHRGT